MSDVPMLRLVRDRPADSESDTAELTLKRGSYRDCKHMEMEIDTELRIVKCSRCGETLDPIECLLKTHGYVEGVRSQAEFNANLRRARALKEAERRRRCRQCKKLFKESQFSSCWNICDTCEAARVKAATFGEGRAK